MNHSVHSQKKRKIFSLLGLSAVFIGVFITLRAIQQNTEQRQFAQTPITYPQSNERFYINIGTSQQVPMGEILSIPAYTLSTTTLQGIVFNSQGSRISNTDRFNILWSARDYSIVGIDNSIANEVTLSGKQHGYTLITATLVDAKTKTVLHQDSIAIKSGEYWNQSNFNKPECSIVAFADDATNKPPVYNLRNKIASVKPNQQFVIATNFLNKTGKQYAQVANHIALGNYLQFIDSNGEKCSYDTQAKVITCAHGMFLNDGATSMAFRVRYTGSEAVPVSVFGTTFASNGDTGSCSVTVNAIPSL